METTTVRDDLFKLYRDLVEEHNFQATDIYNVDETGLQVICKHPKIVIGKGSKRIGVEKPGERSETISAVVCANGAGSIIIPPFIIFRGQSLPANLNGDSYPSGTIFGLSKSGYMVSELFEEWMKMFVNDIPARRPVLLILDGHGSHVSLNVICHARDHDIVLLCLPPHTSHLYQPMDVGVFSSLKAKFQQACASKLQKKKSGKTGRQHFGQLFSTAWNASVTPKNIKGGFEDAGLWPINPFAASLRVSSNTSSSSLVPSTFSSAPNPSDSILSISTPLTPSLLDSTSQVPVSPTTRINTSTTKSSVPKVIAEMFKQSPEKPDLEKKSRRITVAR